MRVQDLNFELAVGESKINSRFPANDHAMDHAIAHDEHFLGYRTAWVDFLGIAGFSPRICILE